MLVESELKYLQFELPVQKQLLLILFHILPQLKLKQHNALEKCLQCCDNLFIYNIGCFGKYISTSLDILLSHFRHHKYKTASMI